MTIKFRSIYNFEPRPAVINPDSEVKQDESLTISQIISLHLRGIPAPVHIYDGVEYENGDSNYLNEDLNEEYYQLENDFTDFNRYVESSGDNFVDNVQKPQEQATNRHQRDDAQSASMSEEANQPATNSNTSEV